MGSSNSNLGITTIGVYGGDVNIADFGGQVHLAFSEAFRRGSPVYVTAGAYRVTSPIVVPGGATVMGARTAQFIVGHTGSVGAFNVTGGDVVLRDISVRVNTVVNSQRMIQFTGGKSVMAENLRIQFGPDTDEQINVNNGHGATQLVGASATPMRGIHFEDCIDFTARNCVVLPCEGAIAFSSKRGIGINWTDLRVSNELSYGLGGANPLFPYRRDFYIAYDVDETRWGHLNNLRTFGIGNTITGVRGEAALRFLGNTTEEGGHLVINSPQFEATSCKYFIFLGGVDWVDVNNPFCGTSDGGIHKDGEAAIKITSLDGTSLGQRSIRVHVQGGNIHNTGRDKTVADLLPAYVVNFATASTLVSASTTDDSFNTSGTWLKTPPVAGDYVEVTGFANASNNGVFKVVSSTTNKIVVNQNLVTAAASGSNPITINHLSAWDSSAIHVEYASEVRIVGTTISDQAHRWGIRLDTTTIRGVAIKSVGFHKNSVAGAMAPILMPEGALAEPGSSPGNDVLAGVVIGGCDYTNWGTIPFIAKGEVNTGASAQNPALVTGATFFSTGLMDATTGLAPTTGGAIEDLTTNCRVVDTA